MIRHRQADTLFPQSHFISNPFVKPSEFLVRPILRSLELGESECKFFLVVVLDTDS